jgi:hypothetical protein
MRKDMRETKSKARHIRLTGLITAVGAVMILIAIGSIGCGGGGGSGVTVPFAGVWVANGAAPTNVLHFPGADFSAGGNLPYPPTPRLTTTFVTPQDTLFDSSANMWVVDGGDGTGVGAAVYRFLFSQLTNLKSIPNPTPNFLIKAISGAPKFTFPQFAAFDSAGNLWVSDSATNPIAKDEMGAIFKFSTAQLGSGAGFSGTPAAVFTNPAVGPGIFNGPIGIAFDSSGNMWVNNNGAGTPSGTTIVEIAAAVVNAASGVSTPAIATTLTTNIPPPGGLATINNPWGILFDSSGNMWITNEQLSVAVPPACSGSVVEFTQAAISGGGIITPPANVVITQTTVAGRSSLCAPMGITMNAAGDIVVSNFGWLSQYDASQITSTGNPAPHTLVAGLATLLNLPAGLTYGPLSLR